MAWVGSKGAILQSAEFSCELPWVEEPSTTDDELLLTRIHHFVDRSDLRVAKATGHEHNLSGSRVGVSLGRFRALSGPSRCSHGIIASGTARYRLTVPCTRGSTAAASLVGHGHDTGVSFRAERAVVHVLHQDLEQGNIPTGRVLTLGVVPSRTTSSLSTERINVIGKLERESSTCEHRPNCLQKMKKRQYHRSCKTLTRWSSICCFRSFESMGIPSFADSEEYGQPWG